MNDMIITNTDELKKYVDSINILHDLLEHYVYDYDIDILLMKLIYVNVKSKILIKDLDSYISVYTDTVKLNNLINDTLNDCLKLRSHINTFGTNVNNFKIKVRKDIEDRIKENKTEIFEKTNNTIYNAIKNDKEWNDTDLYKSFTKNIEDLNLLVRDLINYTELMISVFEEILKYVEKNNINFNMYENNKMYKVENDEFKLRNIDKLVLTLIEQINFVHSYSKNAEKDPLISLTT